MDVELKICQLFKKIILICKTIKDDVILEEKLTELNLVINSGNYKNLIQKHKAEVINFIHPHIDLIKKENEEIIKELNFPHSNLIKENYHLVDAENKKKLWALIKEIVILYAQLQIN